MARGAHTVISFVASQHHYVDHLAPIARCVPNAVVWAYDQQTMQRWRDWGFNPATPESKFPPGDVLVGAAIRDLPRDSSRSLVLVEHGVGQEYGNEHPAYTGGVDREHLSLVIAPSHRVAKAHPAGVAVGSAHVDHLREIRSRALFSDRSLVVFSFHWHCRVHPLAGSAFGYYAQHLEGVVNQLHEEGFTVAGHAHPREIELQKDTWDRLGVPFLPNAEQVAATAGCFIADNTSMLYELAAIGVPVVCLDDPKWKQEEPVGLRFWDHPPGPVIDNPARIIDKVIDVTVDSDHFWRDHRRRVSDYVFAFDDGRSAQRAAEFVLALEAP